MLTLFYKILTQPLINALVFFYNTIAFQDLGWAIVILTVFIRLLLFPLFHKSTRQQIILQRLQPRLKEIQKQFKEDKVKQTEAMLALYTEHGINPFSGLVFLIIQIPILLSLFRIFQKWLVPEKIAGALYTFISNPGALNPEFLGLINLNNQSILMVVLAAILQYFQAKTAIPKKTGEKLSPAERAAQNMVFIGPVLTLLFFWKLPAAISLYWVVSSIISIIQQIIINRSLAHLNQPAK